MGQHKGKNTLTGSYETHELLASEISKDFFAVLRNMIGPYESIGFYY